MLMGEASIRKFGISDIFQCYFIYLNFENPLIIENICRHFLYFWKREEIELRRECIAPKKLSAPRALGTKNWVSLIREVFL